MNRDLRQDIGLLIGGMLGSSIGFALYKTGVPINFSATTAMIASVAVAAAWQTTNPCIQSQDVSEVE